MQAPGAGRHEDLLLTREVPAGWILFNRAGNSVCITAWPDGPFRPKST